MSGHSRTLQTASELGTARYSQVSVNQVAAKLIPGGPDRQTSGREVQQLLRRT